MVISDSLDVPKASAKAVTGESQIAVPLEGLIDFAKERERLSNQVEKLTQERSRLDAQLANGNFVERAPAEKVEALRERQTEVTEQIGTLQANVAALEEA
jgi:valyl-tRNA synthetase